MIKNIAIKLQYDGTNYSGWQKQGNTGNTIQNKLEKILFKMLGEEIEVHGSGRTDAGVHAYGQVANFKIKTDMTAEEIMDNINKFLPGDIGIISAWEAEPRFHSRLNAIKKTYRYKILTGKIPAVFTEKYAFRHTDSLNIELMRSASEYLIGKHDFKSFTDNKKGNKSTVRTIESIEIFQSGNEINIDFTGDSFLYHMVRILSGTLIKVGEGELSPESITQIIEDKNRNSSGPLAPAKGLMLMEVFYK